MVVQQGFYPPLTHLGRIIGPPLGWLVIFSSNWSSVYIWSDYLHSSIYSLSGLSLEIIKAVVVKQTSITVKGHA